MSAAAFPGKGLGAPLTRTLMGRNNMGQELFEFIGKLVTYGGGIVVIAYWTFTLLGKKWIETMFQKNLEVHKRAQNQELENFKYKINSLFSRVSKIHEKEFEVLPEMWGKLHDAKDIISALVSPYQQHPDFNSMKEIEIRKSLESSKFHEHQVEELINSTDKNKYYTEKVIWHRINDARKEFSEFHNYFIRNRIFLTSALQEQFGKIDNLLWESLVSREVGEECKDRKLVRESYKNLKDSVDPIITEIETLAQKRLHYHDA